MVFSLRPLRVAHSTLCTRVLLNLRKAAAMTAYGDISLGDFARSTNLAFETAPRQSQPQDDVPLDFALQDYGYFEE